MGKHNMNFRDLMFHLHKIKKDCQTIGLSNEDIGEMEIVDDKTPLGNIKFSEVEFELAHDKEKNKYYLLIKNKKK